ncbi:MAG: aminotransferase class I/II-fold pyridoxal phosphate-dependent enzyme [Lachnospiraceae bacterium]|nr:aminotransferase class I/II-fold pyridoxal phosphate-dependent enzyme [Lachnospiraceae bacterium]
MKYDFTTVMDRSGKDALAVDAVGKLPGFAPDAPKDGFDIIPMWVADMNFPTAPSIQRAVIERTQHPAFGYFQASDAYFNAIIDWQKTRNGADGLTRECIGYENGVLGGLASALSVFCSRGDSVLLHSPTYIGFTGTLTNNGYNIVHSPLVRDENGTWRMDFNDMEEKLRDGNIHAAVFCSPHNPCGRVWERWEIEEAYRIFKKYDVQVVSDEIWSDLVLTGYKHIPSQSVSEDARNRTVALYAPSKTFNLAGMIGSYHIIYNKTLRDRVRKASSLSHYNDMNVLSMHALVGAYSEEGREWLDELLEVLTENVRYAVTYIREHFEGVSVFEPQGTYMLFPDCEEWCRSRGVSLSELEKRAWDVGVAVQDGAMFHGPWHLRINLALPMSRVREAMMRLDEFVFGK